MLSVGPHMRLIGHPARAAGLERLLDYMLKQEGVWITRRPGRPSRAARAR
jgi:peptidoglycan/xylan/chitin deacetylase (PgdA/CDA1 family)